MNISDFKKIGVDLWCTLKYFYEDQFTKEIDKQANSFEETQVIHTI